MIPSFPKIFAIGSRQTERLFKSEVEITEKIDGSQIGFGVINGELIIRSKGARMYPENPEKMFKPGIEYIVNLHQARKLAEGIFYYGEYLKSPKHNVLVYDRIPINHIALYGMLDVKTQYFYDYEKIKHAAEQLELDIVPLIFKGEVRTVEDLKSNLDRLSMLGKAKIEGFVVKNYAEQLLIGGQVIPILMGKYVSEDFKEVHKVFWKSENTAKGKWDVYKSQFTTPARWLKAIHYLRDIGEIEYSPKDIGKLMKRVHEDIIEEEKENIKAFLWQEFGKQVPKEACKGLPEWYKDYLLSRAIPSQEIETT
jgi:hypothetical protein